MKISLIFFGAKDTKSTRLHLSFVCFDSTKGLKYMKFSQALQGFLINKSAEGMSHRTIEAYQKRLEKFCNWSQDKDVAQYAKKDVVEYLSYLQTNYKPQRNNGNKKPLSCHTISGIYTALSSFFSWIEEEELGSNVVEKIKAPKVTLEEVEPYTEQELLLLLKAVKAKDQKGRQAQNILRNETIILVLLDTGIRIQEFCDLKIADYNQREGELKIVSGKGGKSRVVYIGRTTQSKLWKYLTTRGEVLPSDFLFVNRRDKQFGQTQLRIWFYKLGEKAGVVNVHPHRFRHTFAIEYLRNGGDIFTLQKLLGHTDLNMVRHYARVANIDAQIMHKKASPVDRFFK